MHTCVTGKFCL